MYFSIIENITNIEVIAVGTKIRELSRLIKKYGKGRWKKVKGTTLIQLDNGQICFAELHWYEAHGKGRKEYKIKRIIE